MEEDNKLNEHKNLVVKKSSKNPLKFLKKYTDYLLNNKRMLGLVIIVLAVPITVGLALIQQEIRSRAAGDGQIVMGMSNAGGNRSGDAFINETKAAIEEIKNETGSYPAIYPIWVYFEGNNPRSSFPSKEITDYMDARGIALAIFLEPTGPSAVRKDGRFIFSSNTAETVSPGQIKFNNSNPSSITRIYVSKSASGTENPSELANSWVPGARISMFGSLSNGNVDYGNSNHFDFTVNSKSETTTHWVINVTVTDPGSLSGLFSEGRAVFITMADTNARKFANSAIANGSFDAWFQQFAQDAKAYGKPVLLRYAHEMNGPIFPWGNGQPNHKHGGTSGYGRYRFFNVGNTSQSYVDSWRKIYNTIKPIAPNLKMFWCPSRMANQATMEEVYPGFYPGNAYVDYIGFDAYSTLTSKGVVPSMLQIYRAAMNTVVKISKGEKPIFIGETGITNHNLPSDFSRADWIRNGYHEVVNYDGPDSNTAPDWPQLAGIIYFNFDISGGWGANHNWLLRGTSTASSQANALPAYREILSKSKYQGRFEGVSAPVTPAPVTQSPTIPIAEDTDDQQRKADIAAIQNAVERHRADTGAYPRFSGQVYGWSKAHILLITSYINPIPIGPGLVGTEPCGNNNYKGYVYAGNSTNYAIFTNLENTSDPAVTSRKPIPVYHPTGFTSDGITSSWTGGSCPGTYNYWITGSSTTSTPTPTPAGAQVTAFIESNGSVVMEAENYDRRITRDDSWNLRTNVSNYGGTGFMNALPNDGTVFFKDGYNRGPELVYNVRFTTTGTYYVYLRSSGDNPQSDSAHVGLNGGLGGDMELHYIGEGGSNANWKWKKKNNDGSRTKINVSTPGTHTFHIYMREDGTKIDRIRLSQSSSWVASPNDSAIGPNESSRGIFSN